MKEVIDINKFKTASICISIVLIILLLLSFFEFFFLKILGFQYNSLLDLIFFFILYLFLEIPLSIIVDAIPKALKSTGIIHTSKGLLSLILNITLTFILIESIDAFMKSINIGWQGTFIFALITGFIGWKLKKDDKEPPNFNSEEFKNIDKKFNSES